MATNNNSSSSNNDQNNQHGAMPQELRPYGEDTQDGVDGDARLNSGEQFGAMPGPVGLGPVGLSLDANDPSAPSLDSGGHGKDGLSEALKAERRRSNQLEKELRGVRQQLTRFSEINPEEYSRLQEAERQKQLLEQQVELRERQMEEASAKKVAAACAERDAASSLVLQLRKERLLERAFSEAEGRNGGDGRGTFFDVFKGQLGESFRLNTSKDGSDVLEPLDAQGQPLLGDDGRPMTTAEFLDQLRIHPVYGFLFQQRGAMGTSAMTSASSGGNLGTNGFGEVLNPQAMSASELYRASFTTSTRGSRN
jgi:hypothetical protein